MISEKVEKRKTKIKEKINIKLINYFLCFPKLLTNTLYVILLETLSEKILPLKNTLNRITIIQTLKKEYIYIQKSEGRKTKIEEKNKYIINNLFFIFYKFYLSINHKINCLYSLKSMCYVTKISIEGSKENQSLLLPIKSKVTKIHQSNNNLFIIMTQSCCFFFFFFLFLQQFVNNNDPKLLQT